MTQEQATRTVQLGRYEYRLYRKYGQWYVYCEDLTREKGLEHGPFSVEQANSMIDSRIQRHMDLKKE